MSTKRAGLGCLVLAGTSGSRLFPVTEQMPKALLPVGNRPLVAYLLNTLKTCNARVVVVTTAKFEGYVRAAVQSELSDATVVTVDEMLGSAGAVRDALSKVDFLRRCSELLIVAGETVVGSKCLLNLVDRHRLKEGGCTGLFAVQPTAKGQKDPADVEFLAMDPDGVVAMMQGLFDMDDAEDPPLKVAKAVLRRSPRFELRADLADVHCYVFDGETLARCLDGLGPDSSLKADVLPTLADTYFRSRPLADVVDIQKDVYKRYHDLIHDAEEPPLKPLLAVVVAEDDAAADDDDLLGSELAVRIQTLPLYAALCRRCVARAVRAQGGEIAPLGKLVKRDGSLVGPETVLGEKVNLKHASIGARCKVGNRAKINNSVLFDDVTVHDGAVIQNSILCGNSVVKEKANLNDVQVGANAVVPPSTMLKNESFLADDSDDDEHLIEDDDDDDETS